MDENTVITSTTIMSVDELAERGREAAARYLSGVQGYEILARDWESPFGTVDIIARDGDEAIALIQVSTRMNGDKAGFPEEDLSRRARTKLERMAAMYLAAAEAVDIAVRFDVIGVLFLDVHKALIKHHVNAFMLDRDGSE